MLGIFRKKTVMEVAISKNKEFFDQNGFIDLFDFEAFVFAINNYDWENLLIVKFHFERKLETLERKIEAEAKRDNTIAEVMDLHTKINQAQQELSQLVAKRGLLKKDGE